MKLITLGLIFGMFYIQTPASRLDSLNAWRPDSSVVYDSIPKIYGEWWKEISDCAGVKGKLKRISWFSTGKLTFRCPLVSWCYGWWKSSHEIYVAGGREKDKRLVQHEMLHDLLGSKNPFFPKYLKHHELFEKCKV